MDRMYVQARFNTPTIDRRHPNPPRARTMRAMAAGRSSNTALIGAPAVGTEDFRLWSEWVGHCLAESGSASVEAHLSRFAATALDLGLTPGPARLLADRTQPDILRARAFFAVAMALDAVEPAPSDDGPLAA